MSIDINTKQKPIIDCLKVILKLCRFLSECEEPSSIQHGNNKFVETTYGSIVTYVCNDGYVLNGQSSIKCDVKNGKPMWNSEAPICEEKRMFPL